MTYGINDKAWEYAVQDDEGNDVILTKTKPDDPAQVLLQDPNIFSTPNLDIFKSSCYICRDSEFAQMGLPLCYPCEACGGHVPADDTVCSDCGADAQELYYSRMEAECAEKGHQWMHREEQSIHKWSRFDKDGWTHSEELVVTPEHEYCERCTLTTRPVPTEDTDDQQDR